VACATNGIQPSPDGSSADGAESVCIPGVSAACVGIGGCSGGQVCASDGKSFGPCLCSDAATGSPTLDATAEAAAPESGSADSPTSDSTVQDSTAADQDAGVDVIVTANPDASDGALPTAVSGAVQKGPFVRGSSVTVQELDATLTPTGRSFQVTTSDDEGDFTIPVNVSSRYVEVIASGYYFDELTNHLSSSPLTLHALADLSGGATVNVTLLTSMSEPLVKKLVAGGVQFSQATSQAEAAVLMALGFSSSSLGATFSSVALTGSGSPNGEALAASLIVEQYALSLGSAEVAQLTQVLGEIGAATADAGGDAELAALHAALCPTIWSIAPATVRANLAAYYASLGATATVPPFEQFLCGCGVMCAGTDGGVPTCVNPSTDTANCGGCGVSCTLAHSSGTCVAGSCVHTCFSGYSACGGTTPCAYDTSSDSTHCGSSCATCPSSSSCVGGICTSTGPCTPGATQCSGNAIQTCDSTGNWGSPVACASQACVSGACVGVCTPGATQCSSGLQTCDSNGAWGSPVSCPSECVSGACVSVDGGAVRYGFTTPLGGIANNSGNYLFGMSISVPMPITVTALGVITNATGGQFVMGLYSDTSGNPGSLVVAAAPASATNGVQEFPVTPVAIVAGSYWMVASAGSAGINHWGYAATGSDWASPYTYTGTLPATAPSGTTYTNDSLNFYVVGQ
jgi:hypothetical protein